MSETIEGEATKEPEALTPEQTMEKLNEMPLHSQGIFDFGNVVRVPGGWLYTLRLHNPTTTFVPE